MTPKSGQKIIEGLKDAIAGKFDRVTIDGQVWVKNDASHLAKLQGVNDLQHKEIEALRAALEKIERWFDEFPETGKMWPAKQGGGKVSYGSAYGSNGERDFMRGVARDALAQTSAECL